MAKITIAIPAYNQEKTIAEAIESALTQDADKEILIIDDCSTDRTINIIVDLIRSTEYLFSSNVRLIRNEKNIGIRNNLLKLIKNSSSDYILFLCGDDVFSNDKVASDYCSLFDLHDDVNVITRYYSQFDTKTKEILMSLKDTHPLTSSCQPSGIGIRKKLISVPYPERIFIEMPTIVNELLKEKNKYILMEYDTILARIHEGGNTATKQWYYKGSMFESWYYLLGDSFRFNEGLIQVKNRAGNKKLFKEIDTIITQSPNTLKSISFWMCLCIAIFTPRCILKRLSSWYRYTILRKKALLTERGYNADIGNWSKWEFRAGDTKKIQSHIDTYR
jgi:glycosyltransferase involved in cell wall biosynthesis